MILDNTGNAPAISQQLMKKATILQVGQGIYADAIARMIAAGRVITENMLVETATEAIKSAALYIEVATSYSSMEPK